MSRILYEDKREDYLDDLETLIEAIQEIRDIDDLVANAPPSRSKAFNEAIGDLDGLHTKLQGKIDDLLDAAESARDALAKAR